MKKKETIQLENCRLCGEEKELKKSHIIPRFFYKPMEWNEKNFRYQILGIDSNYKIIRQGGVKEKLLCKECEQMFGGWENYVNKTCILVAVIFNRKPINDLMINPTPIRQDNHRVYRFLFGGFAWAYFVSSHSIPNEVRHVAINESGEMIVSALEIHRLGMIMGLINNIKINGKI